MRRLLPTLQPPAETATDRDIARERIRVAEHRAERREWVDLGGADELERVGFSFRHTSGLRVRPFTGQVWSRGAEAFEHLPPIGFTIDNGTVRFWELLS